MDNAVLLEKLEKIEKLTGEKIENLAGKIEDLRIALKTNQDFMNKELKKMDARLRMIERTVEKKHIEHDIRIETLDKRVSLVDKVKNEIEELKNMDKENSKEKSEIKIKLGILWSIAGFIVAQFALILFATIRGLIK